MISRAKPRGRFGHRRQYPLQIEGGPADNLQDITGCRLILQRLLKVRRALLQRPVGFGAGNGNCRLFGEGPDQFDLSVGEAAHLCRTETDRTERLAIAHDRNGKRGLPRLPADDRIQVAVAGNVPYMDDALLQDRSRRGRRRARRHREQTDERIQIHVLGRSQ
ncbi:MAG: hypothetical protein U1E70_12370 [Acetobacteraceae bacterium]